jgi:hypothetical protein
MSTRLAIRGSQVAENRYSLFVISYSINNGTTAPSIQYVQSQTQDSSEMLSK